MQGFATLGKNLELRNDADLQAELIPQELNTQFVPEKSQPKGFPWHAILPVAPRSRRNTHDVSTVDANAQEVQASTGLSQNFKMYTRVASCVALVVAAVIEIALYILELYK
ncbi:unnamed protein product [Arctia plantaginis]|uniref:Uncharacterized protein n=1 Tax=Arctia plantaginis TaxID=874455 RepID=A0A8S0ZVS9_ARCPL|nr:unnamed protein product [Arctia plantaginis]